MAYATPAHPCAMAELADKIAGSDFEHREAMAPKGRSTWMYGVRRSPGKARFVSVGFIAPLERKRFFLYGEMAELAEGAPLLREYGVYSSIEGSNPSLSAI